MCKQDIKSAYIHIPFCMDICTYCDFCKLYYKKELVDAYLEAFEKEIVQVYKGEKLKTIYIGGGTPSSLDLEQLKRLFQILNGLKKENQYEFTIECNFDSVTKEKIALFKENGINRISFGLESINPDNLKYLGRTLDLEYVREIISYCKESGITNINMDLIYALKNETIDILKKDLDFILNIDISHISTYSLILEENTTLYIKNEKNIDEDLDYEMYQFICKALKEKGFHHYEISNFSKYGYESKHNLTYWYNNQYYGFGLGAASYMDSRRITNTRSISKYLKGDFCLNLENLTNHDKIVYEVVLNLRLDTGIDKKCFFKKYDRQVLEFFNYKLLILDGFLEETDSNIYIPEDKFYLLDEITLKFLEGEINERETF